MEQDVGVKAATIIAASWRRKRVQRTLSTLAAVVVLLQSGSRGLLARKRARRLRLDLQTSPMLEPGVRAVGTALSSIASMASTHSHSAEEQNSVQREIHRALEVGRQRAAVRIQAMVRRRRVWKVLKVLSVISVRLQTRVRSRIARQRFLRRPERLAAIEIQRRARGWLRRRILAPLVRERLRVASATIIVGALRAARDQKVIGRLIAVRDRRRGKIFSAGADILVRVLRAKAQRSMQSEAVAAVHAKVQELRALRKNGHCHGIDYDWRAEMQAAKRCDGTLADDSIAKTIADDFGHQLTSHDDLVRMGLFQEDTLRQETQAVPSRAAGKAGTTSGAAEVYPAVAKMHPAIAEMHPADAEMRSAVAEVHPAVAEVYPPVAAMRSAVAEVHPADAEVHPPVAEVHPPVAAMRSAVVEVHPAVAEMHPAVVEVHPAVAEMHPAIAEVRSAVAEVNPARAEASVALLKEPTITATQTRASAEQAVSTESVRLKSASEMMSRDGPVEKVKAVAPGGKATAPGTVGRVTSLEVEIRNARLQLAEMEQNVPQEWPVHLLETLVEPLEPGSPSAEDRVQYVGTASLRSSRKSGCSSSGASARRALPSDISSRQSTRRTVRFSQGVDGRVLEETVVCAVHEPTAVRLEAAELAVPEMHVNVEHEVAEVAAMPEMQLGAEHEVRPEGIACLGVRATLPSDGDEGTPLRTSSLSRRISGHSPRPFRRPTEVEEEPYDGKSPLPLPLPMPPMPRREAQRKPSPRCSSASAAAIPSGKDGGTPQPGGSRWPTVAIVGPGASALARGRVAIVTPGPIAPHTLPAPKHNSSPFDFGDFLCAVPRGVGVDKLVRSAGRRIGEVVQNAGESATLVMDDLNRITVERPRRIDGLTYVRKPLRVVVRIRPSEGPLQSGEQRVSYNGRNIYINSDHPAMAPLSFFLDGVLAPNHDQEAAYAALGAPAVEALMRGESSTVVAVGAVNVGKTYSMFGPVAQLSNPAGSAWMDWGILPRACHHLFSRASCVGGIEGLLGVDARLWCTFIEICDESINDLLGKGRGLRVRESAARGVHVPEATQRVIEWEEDVMRALVIGLQNRTSTSDDAARGAHVIFTLAVSRRRADGSTSDSSLQLVELGASELPRPGSAVGSLAAATKSVATLAKCLELMAEGTGSPGDPNPLGIPYRDSKLTWLLRDALGANVTADKVSHTSLLACCSGQPEKLPATISTLRFAHRCRHAHVWVATGPEGWPVQPHSQQPQALLAAAHASPTPVTVSASQTVPLRSPASDSDSEDGATFIGGPSLAFTASTIAATPVEAVSDLQARLAVLHHLEQTSDDGGDDGGDGGGDDSGEAVALKLASALTHMQLLEVRVAEMQAHANTHRSAASGIQANAG